MQTPDVHKGLLTSASTRRAGYVYLADVAPTVLDLLGEPVPDGIEGRPFDVVEATGNRVAHLAQQSADAAARDERLPLVVPLVIAALAALALAVVLARPARRRAPGRSCARSPSARWAWSRARSSPAASPPPAPATSPTSAWSLGVAAVVGLVGALVDRRWPGIGRPRRRGLGAGRRSASTCSSAHRSR